MINLRIGLAFKDYLEEDFACETFMFEDDNTITFDMVSGDNHHWYKLIGNKVSPCTKYDGCSNDRDEMQSVLDDLITKFG